MAKKRNPPIARATQPTGVIRNDAQTAIASLVCFDPTQDRPQSQNDIASRVYLYMLGCADRWIFNRELVHSITNYLSRGTRTILHGEKGTGKSTVLHSLETSFKSAPLLSDGPSVEGRLFVLVDFNYNTAHHLGADEAASEFAIASHVLATIEMGIFESPFGEQVGRERDLLLLRGSPLFSQLRAQLRRGGVVVEKVDFEAFNELRGATLYKSCFDECDRAYYNNSTVLQQALHFLNAAITSGVELVIALDNIDQLPYTAKVAIARVAQSVAALNDGRIGVVLACRTEHVSLMRRVLDPGKTWEMPSMPLPNMSTWDIEQIVMHRLNLSEDPELIKILSEYYSTPERAVRFDRELRRSQAQVRNTIRQLWSVDEPKGSAEGELARSLVYWHNGNIRDTSQSIIALSNTELDPRDLSGRNAPTGRRRARNSLYQHLATDRDSTSAGSLAGSVRLFAAEREDTGPEYPPFYFFRFRMLSHLAFKKETRPLGGLFETFQRYGLEPQRTVEVVNSLAQRKHFDSGFLRIETSEGPVDRVTEADVSAKIELLPAGYYLANELVVKCEFLYWNALEVPDCLEKLSAAVREPRAVFIDRFPSEREKVLGATIFLKSYLLPRFIDEHPYMVPGASWTDAHVARLQRFRSDFGYDKDNWFILRLRRSIGAYAKETGVMDIGVSGDAWGEAQAYALQLDRVLRNEK